MCVALNQISKYIFGNNGRSVCGVKSVTLARVICTREININIEKYFEILATYSVFKITSIPGIAMYDTVQNHILHTLQSHG